MPHPMKAVVCILLLSLASLAAAANLPAPPAAAAVAAPATPAVSALPPGAIPAAYPPGCDIPCSDQCCAAICGGHGGNLAVCVNGRPICRCRP
jgi:hypothetical protein